MKPGQRIAYIKESAQNLANYKWSDIDLVLGQFNLPTSDTWSGERKDYVIQHIKDATDEDLQELRNYLVEETDEKLADHIASAEARIWVPNRFKLFISHLASDKLLVTELKKKLEAYGIDCFVAHQDIDPTFEWQDVIESALQTCDALAAFLTDKFHESNWTDQEIGFCVSRRVLIIPIKIGINPYGFIGKYQALNSAKDSSTEVAEKILDILLLNPLTSAKISEAIVEDFVQSGSFESARARSLLLPKIKTWTPELLKSIDNSIRTNGQVSGAFDVPARVKAILSKHGQH